MGTAIWVEKILEGEERLPGQWQCEGTTGYDALRAVTAALVDPTTSPLIADTWTEVGGRDDFAEFVADAKREVVTNILGPERRRLARRACEVLPDADPKRVEEAVVELLVAADVYRAYSRPSRPAADDALRLLEAARDHAVAARPDLREEVERLFRAAARPSPSRAAEVDFAVRLQQTWGPVMAKSVEDTSLYRWHQLIALNEVGGDPGLLEEAGPEVMHAWAGHQQQHWPLGMTTLTTHDTKRSEDVRARVLAVAGDAESWSACSEAYAQAADLYGVDRPTAHLLWQTLVGVGRIAEERLHDYLVKAVREAKQHTAWIDGDPDYEQRVLALATAALAPGHLKALVDTAVDHNLESVRAFVLGQKLLQLTLPGAPDIYQGCEVVNLTLVDPDNRRPVDFEGLRRRIDDLVEHGPRDLDDEKLYLTVRTLALRKELRDFFGDGGRYDPLRSTTRHVIGFTRGDEVAVLVTRAPRRLEAAGGWGPPDPDPARRAVARRAHRHPLRGRDRALCRRVRGDAGRAAAPRAHLMVVLTVWAPRAQQVEVVLADRRVPMAQPVRSGGPSSTSPPGRRTPSPSTAARRGPTRGGCGCPRARTAGRCCSTRPSSRGPTRAGAGCRWRGR